MKITWAAVLRIQDVYPGSEFFHPGSRIRSQKDSGSQIRIQFTGRQEQRLESESGQTQTGRIRIQSDLDKLALVKSDLFDKICKIEAKLCIKVIISSLITYLRYGIHFYRKILLRHYMLPNYGTGWIRRRMKACGV